MFDQLLCIEEMSSMLNRTLTNIEIVYTCIKQ